MRGEIIISLDNLGKKVKQVRLSKKKTQQQIADACTISKSLLSKIENGQTTSAIATLSKISKALEVPLSWLLEDHEEKDLVISKQAQQHAKAGDEHMGYSFELLANRSQYTGVDPTIVHVTPKNINLRTDTYTHSQDEFIYILEGSIELFYNGDKHVMNQGDSANFKGTSPHLFIPVDNLGAKVLTLFIETNE